MNDLLIIHNYDGNFINTALQNVYTNTLKLKKTHKRGHKCKYFDLSPEVNDNRIETNLYNKTDSSYFKLLRFPTAKPEGLVKKRNTIYTETLRISNTCSKCEHFCQKFEDLRTLLLMFCSVWFY